MTIPPFSHGSRPPGTPLSWLEISKTALVHNLRSLRQIAGSKVCLAPTVKANGYGHGLLECGALLAQYGADALCVNSLAEALRKAGVEIPLLVIGYTPLSDVRDLVRLRAETVVYNVETLEALARLGQPAGIHLKIETGNHRQGIRLEDLPLFIDRLKRHPTLQVNGVSTHFANLEDDNHPEYAQYQLGRLAEAVTLLERHGISPRYRHAANTAATLVLPEARFNWVRVGLGIYGLWPSPKTEEAMRQIDPSFGLRPVLTWKTRVAQVKEVEKGALVGYGCTYKMKRKGAIAVLPIGYYDGFVRLLGNRGAVLIRGKRAPVAGRVCMNMVMVDVTDIPHVRLEEEVVLIGSQGEDRITAEEAAAWSKTINYEVTTRIRESLPRIVV